MVRIPADPKARILGNLKRSVETWDFALMEKSVDQAMKAGIPAEEIMEEGLGKGMESISKLFDNAKIYLPQVMAASRTVEGALKKLEPILNSDTTMYRGTIVMGSVEGDIADAAKKLGGTVKFVDAVHFIKGEGIEKKQEDFAAEVAAQMNMGK